MTEMRGMLVGLMRVVDTLVTNYARQPQVPQEARGSGGIPPIAPTAPVVAVDIGSQLLKDFIVFRPPAFHGGTDAVATENWMLSIKKGTTQYVNVQRGCREMVEDYPPEVW